MKNNFSIIENFINNKDFSRTLYSELSFLEKEGKFEEPLGEHEIRSDRTFWVSLSQMDKKSFPKLFFICQVLSSIPYELNSKT